MRLIIRISFWLLILSTIETVALRVESRGEEGTAIRAGAAGEPGDDTKQPATPTTVAMQEHGRSQATGSFDVIWNDHTHQLVIRGRFADLSSLPTIPAAIATDVQGNVPTECHLHVKRGKQNPAIRNLRVYLQPRKQANKGNEENQRSRGKKAQPSPLVLDGEFFGCFQLSDREAAEFADNVMSVILHTKKYPAPPGELSGKILDAKDIDDQQMFAVFPDDHAKIVDYRRNNTYPVLPLAPNPKDVLDDSPIPPPHAIEDAFLDKRSEKDRYLRRTIGLPEALNRHKLYVDHPNPQPRPFRAYHIRYHGALAMPAQTHPRDPLLVQFYQRHVNPRYVQSQQGEDDAARVKNVFEPIMVGGGSYDPSRSYQSLPRVKFNANALVTYADTPPAMFPEVDPFKRPPGTNMLPTVYENMRDRRGVEMPNTLPSQPNNPYNLHDGDPHVERLETFSSPTDDLRLILDEVYETITGVPFRRLWEQLDSRTIDQVLTDIGEETHSQQIKKQADLLIHHAEWAIDILEGNDGRIVDDGVERQSRIPGNRAYRRFALLHHSGHKRATRVKPVYDEHGKVVAGTVDVHQIWYDGRIESDTMFYDFGWDDVELTIKLADKRKEKRWYSPTDDHWDQRFWNRQTFTEQDVAALDRKPEPIPHDVPITAIFTIDVLNRGEDDFSPSIVYFDHHEQIKQNVVLKRQDVPAKKTLCAPGSNPAEAAILSSAGVERPWGKLNLGGQNTLIRFGPPHIAMDATFFPLQEGTRTVLRTKLAPAQYHNVHYTWGWRKHPPRAQAVENMHKRIPPHPAELKLSYGMLTDDDTATAFFRPNLSPRVPRLRIDDHERFVFEGIDKSTIEPFQARYLAEEMVRCPIIEGESKAAHRKRVLGHIEKELRGWDKDDGTHVPGLLEMPWLARQKHHNPIDKIGDLAPAKRMWRSFRSLRDEVKKLRQGESGDVEKCLFAIIDARNAFLDWKDRNHLPSGLQPDPKSDLTMLFVNNTMYGEMTDGAVTRLEKWKTRGTDVRIALLNGDYFVHGYVQPDFGGLRGWENQFKPTLALGGEGSMFTFGRFNWRFNVAPGIVPVPPAHIEKCQPAEKEENPSHYASKRNRQGKLLPFSSEDCVVPGVHRVWVRLNFEPSRRLRFYQFDPLHHDVAIYSIH